MSSVEPLRQRVIDVHHHMTPPTFLREFTNNKSLQSARPLLEWSPSQSIEEMDRAGVDTAILSAPNMWFFEEATVARLARDANEYAARLRTEHPTRFGVFALLPMPHIEPSLREIDYAFDELNADGVALMTSYGDRWLGDPYFAPLFEKLNHRKAVVFVHPKAADCCGNLQPYLGDSTIEYPVDTARAIGSLIFQGRARTCPDVRFIFSHGGGIVPFIIERFIDLPRLSTSAAVHVPDGVVHQLSQFYYDLALASHPIPFGALRQLIPMSQILFGSDFPLRTATERLDAITRLQLEASERDALLGNNALRIMPKAGR